MRKKVTVTKAYIESLKNDKAKLEKQIEDLSSDLAKHRDFYVRLLRIYLNSLGKGEITSPAWIIEQLAKHLNTVKSWYWS